jgi:dTDP-4-dehydrorhamnose reductase
MSISLWGGVECTVNRVGDGYFDQVERSGHASRIADLDAFAALGIRAIRYPVLWERVAPDDPSRPQWSWTDQRLARLRELGMNPIAGLLHHGSGPRYTSLLDPGFPALFARYSRMVAERYP